MIRSSFLFLDGIGEKKEKALWGLGIKSWTQFTNSEKILGISPHRKYHYDRKIKEAQSALYNFDSKYFINKLNSVESWRLYNFFKEDAVFLDIEASGAESDSFITTIGMFDGIDTKTMIHGINLDLPLLKKILSNYKLIITFNGSTFDLPMLRKKFPEILPDIPHWDLRHACARVGLKGGLKQIEKELGIKRTNNIVERMYGGDPITLWRMFRGSGDEYYLKLLIEYNEEDCINLKSIANKVYDKLVEQSFNTTL